MSDAEIGYSAEAGVARIVLHQPAKMNAMTLDMWRTLPEAMARANDDPAVRVITIQGAGDRAFCAGADISQFGDIRSSLDDVRAYDEASDAAYLALASAGKPTVAVIHGICFGGGMALAMCCDLRVASAGSRFRVPAGRLGLGYGYDPVMALLRRLGPGATADIMFTARILSTADALTCGVLQQVFPAESFAADAAGYVGMIAENAPLTLAAIKRTLLDWDLPEAQRNPAAVAEMVAKCFASDDYKEGQAAFKARRTPVFTGR